MLALELSLVPRSNSCILSPTNFRNFKDSFFVHRNYRISQSSSVLKFGRKVQNSALQVRAATGDVEELKWWQKNGGPNMHDIHSTQEFIDELSKAGEKLVIVEFYGTWCGSCRALFPKFCKLAAEHPDVIFLKVNFDENKSMCKRLNVKVLPYFHFYRGADGCVDSFSCSLAKLQKLKDAIELHSADRCSLGPPLGVGDIDFPQASNSKSNSNDKSTATGSSR